MFSNNIDNSILINTDSKPRNQKIHCVLCSNEKIELICINSEENRYKCPRCKNDYQIGFEILPSEEDILESSHESGNEGPLLLSAEDNELETREDNNKSKSDIKIPKYFKDSETTTVTHFREE